MKVIELLTKIANGEDVPEKIRYEENIWKLKPLNDTYDNGECCLFEDYIDKKYVITDVLLDDIEIIGEDKKIKEIDMFDYFTGYDYGRTNKKLLKDLEHNFETLNSKINEIINCLNKEK